MADTRIEEPAEVIEARTAFATLQDEARSLADADTLTEEQDARLVELLGEDFQSGELRAAEDAVKAAEERGAKAEARAKALAEIRSAPGVEVSRGIDTFTHIRKSDPHDVDPRGMAPGELRSAALKVMEAEGKHLEARQLENVDRLVTGIERDASGDIVRNGAAIAERILYTSRPAYRSAFQKAVNGHEAHWTDEERAAMAVRTSMSLGDTNGGYGVPAPIDPTIILTSGAADAPVLSVATIKTITNDKWTGVTTASATPWSFDSGSDGDAGGVEVSDDAPTLGQPSITAHTARGFIPYSFEIEGDYPGFASEMSKLMSQGYLDLMAQQSVTGSGNAPIGVFTGVFQHGQGTEVFCDTNGEINGADVRKVWAALPERFRGRARWLMNVSVENQIRAAGNGNNGADFTVTQTAEGITLLNGKPVMLTDYAPEFSNTTTAQTNHLVLGAFDGFTVVQRAGMSVERVNHLFHTNANRPNGERGLLAWARVGHDVVVDNAFRGLANASV